jgi:hypothetical protein
MAVLAARFFDLLASHESKAFLQTAADAACRCVELANSPEATIMAAEFTANVVHALEAEHAQHHHHSCDDMSAAAAAAAASADASASDGAVSGSRRRASTSSSIASSSSSCISSSAAAAAEPDVTNYESTICEKFTVPSTPVPGARAVDRAVTKAGVSEQEEEVKGISQAELDAESDSLLASSVTATSTTSTITSTAAGAAGSTATAVTADVKLTAEKLKEQQQQQQSKQHAASSKKATSTSTEQQQQQQQQQQHQHGDDKEKSTKLPRYTREHFESVLTKRTKTLAEQAPPATAASIEAALAAAERRVGRQLTEAAAVNEAHSHDEAASLVQALAILAGILLWSLLGLYGLKQLVTDVKTGVPGRDEL